MLHKYSAIVIALFGLGMQNASAGNEQAQRMILGGSSVGASALPAAATYKPERSGQDQASALLAPVFVSGAYVGTATSVALDGHEQARRMIAAK
ncbi:MAG: hypothetical protein M3Q32_10485 [Pseudomonadota bacterium]|nr:hypothetical protein [Burkholderiales bacterium]MDQ3196762.1 hypothetical protein [Pseudomonadota bacterium]